MDDLIFKTLCSIEYNTKDITLEEAIHDNFEKLDKKQPKKWIHKVMRFQAKIDCLSSFLMSKKLNDKKNKKEFEVIIKYFDETLQNFKEAYQKEMEK